MAIQDFVPGEWDNYVENNFCLNLGVINSLEEEDELELLVMDRNLYDIAFKANVRRDEPYDPCEFFRKNKAIYIHDHGTQGTLTLYSDTDDSVTLEQFEWHLDISGDPQNDTPFKWYPLEGNMMRPKSHPDLPPHYHKYINMYLDSTKVGYRGPVILWESLYNDSMPYISFKPLEI